MTTSPSRQLSELLVQTHTSLENARNGDWERVIKDEQSRRNKIAGLFAEPMDANETAKYRKTIEEILRLNKELEQLITRARNMALSGAGSISKGRRAMKSYANNGG